MKQLEISILTWGIYMLLLGTSFILIPAPVAGLFGYIINDDLWLRVVGILSVVLALYYIQMAVHKISVLYPWKIAGHSIGIVCMMAFLYFDITDSRIIGTILIELFAAAWTAIALIREKTRN